VHIDQGQEKADIGREGKNYQTIGVEQESPAFNFGSNHKYEYQENGLHRDEAEHFEVNPEEEQEKRQEKQGSKQKDISAASGEQIFQMGG